MNNNNQLFTTVPQIDIIAGDTKILPFEVTRVDGGTVDLSLSGTIIAFYLTPYDDPDTNVLTLSLSNGGITIDASNHTYFDVKLFSSDTAELSGDYTFQIEVTPPSSDTYRPIQGTLHFFPKNT